MVGYRVPGLLVAEQPPPLQRTVDFYRLKQQSHLSLPARHVPPDTGASAY